MYTDGCDHIKVFIEHKIDHRRGAVCVVSRVAVDEDENVGLDVGEYSAYDVSFALTRLAPDDHAGLASYLDSAICGIIVVEEYRGLRKHATEVADNATNRLFFIVARQEDRYTSLIQRNSPLSYANLEIFVIRLLMCIQQVFQLNSANFF